ncbi:MAG: ubiquitin-like small modifier protein 1 [Candidatus Thorarchaeota archaeon]
MNIHFKLFGPIRTVCGTGEMSMDVPEESRVKDVIEYLVDRIGPELHSLLKDDDGISGNFIVMINKRDVNILDGLETRVHDGDELALLPHVQGG